MLFPHCKIYEGGVLTLMGYFLCDEDVESMTHALFHCIAPNVALKQFSQKFKLLEYMVNLII